MVTLALCAALVVASSWNDGVDALLEEPDSIKHMLPANYKETVLFTASLLFFPSFKRGNDWRGVCRLVK